MVQPLTNAIFFKMTEGASLLQALKSIIPHNVVPIVKQTASNLTHPTAAH